MRSWVRAKLGRVSGFSRSYSDFVATSGNKALWLSSSLPSFSVSLVLVFNSSILFLYFLDPRDPLSA